MHMVNLRTKHGHSIQHGCRSWKCQDEWTQIDCTQQASVVDGASNHSPSTEWADSPEQQVERNVSKIGASCELVKQT